MKCCIAAFGFRWWLFAALLVVMMWNCRSALLGWRFALDAVGFTV
ncbi:MULTISPECIES: hypothetical protein [unclassified Campylobacter]